MKHLFKKIPKQKVSDKVFDQIKTLITSGKLLPGQKIPSEKELMGLFDVSRSSVREAVLRLECLGFVVQRHGDGTFVQSATEAVVLDYMAEMSRESEFMSGLIQIRQVLETWAASAAAVKALPEDIQAMEATVRSMIQERTAQGRKKQADRTQPQYTTNVTLHQQIANATHNPFLVHMMNAILAWIGTVTDQIYPPDEPAPELYREITDQHKKIVDAIAARDPETAAQAMADHLSFVGTRIVATHDPV